MWTITQNDPQAIKNNQVIGEMYPYQLSTVSFMETFEKRNFTEKTSEETEEINVKTNVGVLANDSGSGKTRVLLALVANNKNNCSEDSKKTDSQNTMTFCQNIGVSSSGIPYNSGDSFVPEITSVSKKTPEFPENSCFIGASLVICSQLNLKAWTSEIKKAMVSSFGVYYVDTNKKAASWTNVYENSNGGVKLVLCSSSFYNNLVRNSENMVWDRVIIDDPEFLKGIKENVKTRFTWFVTSTPEKLNCIRGTSMINSVLGNIRLSMEHFMLKCSDEYSDQMTSSRVKFENFLVEYVRPAYINILRSHFSPEVRSLVAEKKYEEAVLKMGGDVMSEKCIIDTYTRTTEAKIRELELQGNTEDKNRLLSRLSGIKEKITNMKNETCGVCFSDLEAPVMTKCCNNFVCMECIHESMKYKACCVYCRAPVSFSSTILISEKEIDGSGDNTRRELDIGDKKTECVKVIRNAISSNQNGKTLIVVSRGIREITQELINQKIDFSDVASSRNVNIVKKALGDFRATRGTNVLVLGAYDTISGINLDNVNNVIFYDIVSCNTIRQILGKVTSMSRLSEISLKVFSFSDISMN